MTVTLSFPVRVGLLSHYRYDNLIIYALGLGLNVATKHVKGWWNRTYRVELDGDLDQIMLWATAVDRTIGFAE